MILYIINYIPILIFLLTNILISSIDPKIAFLAGEIVSSDKKNFKVPSQIK